MAERIATGPIAGERLSSAPSTKRTALLFAFLVSLFCLWALSLPLFPTQDGPIHKYYIHVIASLLSGSTDYHAYAIRHPFPPYVVHYAFMLGLTKFFSFNLSEKIFICLIFILTAYSFRYCARSLGRSGDLLSLCMVPLILHWAVVMGFLNYSVSLALAFLAIGLWQRAGAGRTTLWLAFLVVVAVTTMTHPVPLLLLIGFCGCDLAVKMLQDRARGESSWFGMHRWQLMGFAATCVAFLYPLASADRSRSESNLHLFALHKDAVISSVALYGISPFDTRSTNFLIDFYRLGLYAILLGAVALAAAGFQTRWRTRTLRTGDTLLICALFLLVAIPILPETMNGSDYFAQRLMPFPWVAAIAAAGGYAARSKLRTLVPVFAVVMTVATLLPAEIFIRPVATQLAAIEAQPLPTHTAGLAIMDQAMLKAVRLQHQLGFNPYVWSAALPFIHANDVMLNSPWTDLTIMPVKMVPGEDLMVNEVISAGQSVNLVNGNIDLPALSPELRSSLLASTHVIVSVAVPKDLQQGLTPLIGAEAAAGYTCDTHGFYQVCTR